VLAGVVLAGVALTGAVLVCAVAAGALLGFASTAFVVVVVVDVEFRSCAFFSKSARRFSYSTLASALVV